MEPSLHQKSKFWQSLKLMLFTLVVSVALAPPSFSSSTHNFDMTRSISSDPLDFELKLAFEVTIAVPKQMDIGKSSDIVIDVEGAVSEVHYEEFTLGTSGDKSFWAPIGESSRMYVTSFFGGIFYYFEFDTVVSANITVVGNGMLSDESLAWDSAGTESVVVTHTGSSEETLEVQMTFEYVALLTIWKANEQGYFIDKEPHILAGMTQPVSEAIQIVPPSGMVISGYSLAVVIIFVSIGAIGVSVGYIILHKKKEKPTQSDYINLHGKKEKHDYTH